MHKEINDQSRVKIKLSTLPPPKNPAGVDYDSIFKRHYLENNLIVLKPDSHLIISVVFRYFEAHYFVKFGTPPLKFGNSLPTSAPSVANAPNIPEQRSP